MPKNTKNYCRYSKTQITTLKCNLLEHLKAKKTIQQFEKLHHISPNTIKKWRMDDVIFDQAIKDHNEKRSDEVSRVLHYVPLSDPTKKQKIIDDVCAALRRGAGFVGACLYANVTQHALVDLMKKEPDVMDKVNKAEGEFILHCTQHIIKKAETNWQAAAWLLERRYPQFWGETKNLNVRTVSNRAETAIVIDSGAEAGEDASIKISKMTDEELQNAIDELT